MSNSIWHYPDGFWPNFLGISYTFFGYFFGIWLLLQASIIWNFIGVLLVTHTLIYSAYFVHELLHETIFRRRSMNSNFVVLLSWLNGACYASANDLRHMHIRHHIDRVDVTTFDFKEFLLQRPVLRKITLALEWAYIPAVEFIMRTYVIASAFIRKERRIEVILIFLARLGFLWVFALTWPKTVILYALSYLIFIHAIRFIDAYQHTYEAYNIKDCEKAPGIENRDREYEHQNTYSNLISTRYPWLNLLTLNFVYHNAHHAKIGAPWYELASLHETLYGPGDSQQVLPVRTLFENFHKYRVERVMSPDYRMPAQTSGDAKEFIGAVGVSFLTEV